MTYNQRSPTSTTAMTISPANGNVSTTQSRRCTDYTHTRNDLRRTKSQIIFRSRTKILDTIGILKSIVLLLLSSSSASLLLLSFIPIVYGGLVDYAMIMEPTDAEVHYNDGYIVAPGFIDLGSLTFTAVSPVYDLFGGGTAYDDETTGGEGDEDNDDDDDQRAHHQQHQKHRHHRKTQKRQQQGDTTTAASTVVDIVIFHLPQKCANLKNGCDWPDLGVGKHIEDEKKSSRWCCSDETVALGLCRNETLGRLILDDSLFTGNHREVIIPNEGDFTDTIKYGKMEETESGMYVVLFANCNVRGREVYVEGESVWKSKHGYLPGELYGFMYFFVIITIVYLVLWALYGCSMKFNAAYQIGTEKWIMLAISLGLMEMIFRSLDYFIWNMHGYRSTFIIWIGVITGVLKQGISRCLIVMVSLGYGVVRDTLGSTMRWIVVLGASYIAIFATRDLLIMIVIEDFGTISTNEEIKMINVAQLLTLVIAAIDVIFILFIFYSLNNTVIYLDSMNQTPKLERFKKLRCLLVISIVFAVILAIFAYVVGVNDEGLVAEEHLWAIDAVTEVNYLFVLIVVALSNAQEYAYVMELSAEGSNGENEVELSDVVPSAADSDDAADDGKNICSNDYSRNGRNGNKGCNDNDMEGPDGRFEMS